MEQYKQSEAGSAAWQFTKGLSLTQIALTTALINSGVITVEDVIKELDVYINYCTERDTDSIIVEPIKMFKDGLSKLYPEGSGSPRSMATFISDIIGNA